ncbi:MAG: hypothetical protein FJ267_20485 [Planctomycetes bacterium]|nr:hypothetical protein [Planctomycetota bacterium]
MTSELTIDIMSIDAGQLAKARTQRIKFRLEELQGAVETARSEITQREAEITVLEDAVASAQAEYDETIETVRQHLEVCGMGPLQRLASYKVAQDREFQFRIKNNDISRDADAVLQLAKNRLRQGRVNVSTAKENLASRIGELESFIKQQTEV